MGPITEEAAWRALEDFETVDISDRRRAAELVVEGLHKIQKQDADVIR